MKTIIKITTIIISIILFSTYTYATFLPAEKVPELSEVSVSNIYLEDYGSDSVQVIAVTSHTNNCFIPNSKVKTKTVNDNTVSYELFGYDNERKICPTVMDPIYKNVVLDIIPKNELNDISNLKVNNLNINL